MRTRVFVDVSTVALVAVAAWQMVLDIVPSIYGWHQGVGAALALKVLLGWLGGYWPQRWRWLAAIAVVSLLAIPSVVLTQAGLFIVFYRYADGWPWTRLPLALLCTALAIGLSAAIAALIDTWGVRSLRLSLGLSLLPALGLTMGVINGLAIAVGSFIAPIPWRAFWF